MNERRTWQDLGSGRAGDRRASAQWHAAPAGDGLGSPRGWRPLRSIRARAHRRL